MRSLIYIVPLLFFIVLATGSAFAQKQEQKEDPKVSGLFVGVSFERFAELVEKDTPYRFLFKKEEVVNLTVSLQANGDKLEDVLGVLFLKTEFTFSISKDFEVFIFKGEKKAVEFLPN